MYSPYMVLPYKGYTGMCRSIGYAFCLSNSGTGLIFLLNPDLTLSSLAMKLRSFHRFISKPQTKSSERFVMYASVFISIFIYFHCGYCLVQGTFFAMFVWNKVANSAFFLWDRSRVSATQRHTLVVNFREYPPPPGTR